MNINEKLCHCFSYFPGIFISGVIAYSFCEGFDFVIAESKIDIKEFIWNSYYGEIDKKDPQSLALFEKKIKSLCREIKDKTLAKYFLDSFMRKIEDLTPHSNFIGSSNMSLVCDTFAIIQVCSGMHS